MDDNLTCFHQYRRLVCYLLSTKYDSHPLHSIVNALTRNDCVTLPLLTAAITLLAKMLRSNESVPAAVGEQNELFTLLANCFDMVNTDDLTEGANLTASLLQVFDALLSVESNQTKVAHVPAVIRALLTLVSGSIFLSFCSS